MRTTDFAAFDSKFGRANGSHSSFITPDQVLRESSELPMTAAPSAGGDYQLIDFNLEHISDFFSISSSVSKLRTNKRRKITNSNLAIDNLQYQQFASKTDLNELHDEFEPLEVVKRKLYFKSQSPVNLMTNEQLLSDMDVTGDKIYTLSSGDIKLTIDNTLLVVQNTRIGKFPIATLFSFLFHGDILLLATELSIIKYNNTKLQKNHCQITSPILEVVFNCLKNTIEVNITYSILLRFDLYANKDVEFCQKISTIVDEYCDIIPTTKEMVPPLIKSDEKVSAQLFYKAISEHTALIPGAEKQFDIPELETSLLRFQRRTLKWLLERENIRLDTSLNRCFKKMLIEESTSNLITNFLSQQEVDLEKLDSDILLILNKLCFGWARILINEQVSFYNKFTANIIERHTICKYLLNYEHQSNKEIYPQYLPAQALLAEEMGLGKTVEITTLILMNQRPLEEINDTIKVQLREFGDLKTIVKAKTTLIIAPDSILKQWMEEIIHLAPSLPVTIYKGIGKYPKLDNNPNLIAEYLRKFDVVFTTYATISKELDYALYSSKNKTTRNSTKRKRTSIPEEDEITDEIDDEFHEPPNESQKSELTDYQYLFQLTSTKPKIANMKSGEEQEETDYEQALQNEISMAIRHNKIPSIYKLFDYESPLMLTQFWRVVLDEVQMVSSKLSRAFKSAALIPRFHAWGVSGTPIKKSLDDLHSVLQFLKYQPFTGDIGKYSWRSITESPGSNVDFVKLWTLIAIRHTKAMVHDDIKLPPQNRVLLTIPFTPVEQDYYNQSLEACLGAISLDVNGNPTSNDWEPTPVIMTYMRNWLLKLRQLCCNPQIGKLNLGSKKYRKAYTNQNGIGAVQQLKTLELLLNEMLTKAYTDIVDTEKQIIELHIDIGVFHEYIYEPEQALTFLRTGSMKNELVINRLKLILQKYIEEYKVMSSKFDLKLAEDDYNIGNIEDEQEVGFHKLSKDESLEKYEEKIRSTRVRIRNGYISLHRLYFLIASSYFQQYDEEYRDIIGKYHLSETDVTPPDMSTLNDLDTERKDELSSLVNDVPIEKFRYELKDPLLGFEGTTHVEKCKYLELKYYALAESTRQEILLGSIINVAATVKSRIISRGWTRDAAPFIDDGIQVLPKNSKKFFSNIPEIKIEEFSSFVVSMRLKVFLDKLERVIELLNGQADTINHWMGDLVEILCKPLLSHDKDPNGEEYEESIKDQDKASSYLYILALIMGDRSDCLSGSEKSEKVITIKNLQERRDAQLELQKVNDIQTLADLQKERNLVKPKSNLSFQELVLQIKSIESELKDEEFLDPESNRIQQQLLIPLGEKLRTVLVNQKLSIVLLQKELNVNCNAVFNSRIDYFKQLQQISDSVKTITFKMDRENLLPTEVSDKFSQFEVSYKRNKLLMDRSIAKFRYLRGLVGSNESGKEEDESMMCIICRSTISIGSLTQCGHKYCKFCLEHWLRKSLSCPMCKSHITISSVYNFTHNKLDLQANKVEDRRGDGKATNNLYSIYHPITQDVIEEIELIKLKNSYSSKVDLIVKQVLYLRSQDPQVQIVVFSQWQDMLFILGTAFKTVEINYLASYGTLTPEVGGGRRHKKYDSVERFKDPRNNITCFLLNAKAQAAGLTLINATHIFLCEPLVNTSLELQAISRIHRIGQTKPTTVWMFTIANTVEESIVLTSTNKRLQYMEQATLKEEDENDQRPSKMLANAKERNLSKAESMAFMNSEGIDKLVDKGTTQGESVTNTDLWNAFFSAKPHDSSKKLVRMAEN